MKSQQALPSLAHSPEPTDLASKFAELERRIVELEARSARDLGPNLELTSTDTEKIHGAGASIDAHLDPHRSGDSAAREAPLEDRASFVVFSGELDRLLAAFIMATGSAATGMETSLFFTFWATTALRKGSATATKSLSERMFGWMLPRGTTKLPLSRLNLGGAGGRMMRSVMRTKGVASLEELLELAAELGVQLRVCTMSMDLLGIRREELIDYPHLELCGVASFVETAARSRISMFI